MHLDDERLQRLLDGELRGAREGEARAHLAGCEICRGRLTEAGREQAEVFGAFRALDRLAHAVTVDSIVARARRSEPSSSRPVAVARLAWAAGFAALLVLGGIAFALPGSPLRAWVTALAGWNAPARTQTPAPSPVAEVAGLSVAPGERLVVSFLRARAGGQVRVVWSDGGEVEVRAPRGAATFESGTQTLRVDDLQPVTYEVRVPRAAPEIEIQVAGVSLFHKVGEQVTAPAPSAAGEYLLPLEPAHR